MQPEWQPDELAEDEVANLAKMVVDFNRTRGLRDADDDDLLEVVIAAYAAGKKAGSLGTIAFMRGNREAVQ
jgi:hypothetical protein